jgi:phosphatidylglycerol:prolipoprotein diacylglycerol transferase
MPSPADPVAFTVGPLAFRWYAIFILSGILAGIWVITRIAQWRGQDASFITDATPIVILVAVLGARLYFVALEWRYFRNHPDEILGLQLRGLTIHGALAGGVLSFWWYCRRRDQPFLRWADTIAVGIPVGQAIGRWGNWANQEAFGRPTGLPWGVRIDAAHRPAAYPDAGTFHPTFLYEMICSIIVALILWQLIRTCSRRPWWRDGYALALYLALYGVIRLIIESMRTDSLRIGPWPAAYWLSVALFLAGALLALIQSHRTPDGRPSTAT